MDSKHVIGLYEAYRSVYEGINYSPIKAHRGEDIGKPGKMFKEIERKAAKRYGSKKSGKRVAGAVLANLRNEEVDLYDVVLDHLLDEGYCDDVDSAEIIMANMSEEWLDGILEGVADKRLSPEDRANERNLRTFTYIKGEKATRYRRKEHKDRRGIRGNIGGEGAATYRYDDERSDKPYPSFRVRGRGYA